MATAMMRRAVSIVVALTIVSWFALIGILATAAVIARVVAL